MLVPSFAAPNSPPAAFCVTSCATSCATLRHVLLRVLRHVLRLVLYVLVLHVSSEGKFGGGMRVLGANSADGR